MPADMKPSRRLSAFTPEALHRALGQGKAGCFAFEGAALFADISGYTMLAEELCGQGTTGREQLSRILNDAFSFYVDCVHAENGEIASFAGDGFLAYWPAANKPLSAVLASAERCASALHGSEQRSSNTGPNYPSVHIGIAAGPLWAAQLGGVDGVWHRILAGAAAAKAFDAAAKAGPGETVRIPADSYDESAEDVVSGLSEAAAWFVPSEHKVSKGDVSIIEDNGMVPRVVREWWSDKWALWLPQIRNISALFVKIGGLMPEADDSLEHYQEAIAGLQRAIRPYTASTGTLVADDKGLVFKLCFGMPYNTHRDDRVQALRSALAINQILGKLGFHCTCGVANGEGVCMPLGGSDRLDYAAIGRFAHLAARLMDSSKAGVLCTRDVAEQARREVSLIHRSPIMLKGVRDPVEIYEVQAVSAERVDGKPMLGRSAELTVIDDHLDRLRSGQGSIVHILGDAGIGKTTLIQALVSSATAADLTVLAGSSTMSEVVVSYRAWRSVFARLLGLDDETGVARPVNEDIDIKLEGLPDDQQKLLPLLNAVLPGVVRQRTDIERLSGEARVDATLTLLTGLFRFLVPPGCILVLEDCHWMDSASWRLLQRLTTVAPDMLVVLTSRPHPDKPIFSSLKALPRFAELHLQPLDQALIRQLVTTRISLDATRPHRSSWVDEAVRLAMGNPLFAQEYAYLAWTRRQAGSGPARELGEGSEATVPMTLHSLITSRLDSLAPRQLITLKAASAIGNRFDLPLLGKVIPDRPGPSELFSIMTELAQHHIVLVADEDTKTYAFQHDLIREVVYGQLTRQQKQDLHDRAAKAIEVVHGDRLDTQFALLADHWDKADNGSQTMKYAELAAAQALGSGGYIEAHRLLGLCFKQADANDLHWMQMSRRIRWHRLAADAHFGLGNIEERGKAAQIALRIIGTPHARTRAGHLGGALLRLAAWWSAGRLGLGRSPTDTELALEVARIYRHSAAVAWFSNDPITMAADSINALYYAERAAPSDVLAGACVEFGGILGLLGLRYPGRTLMRRALAISEEAGDRSSLAYAHLLICLFEVGIGEWAATDRHALVCEKLCDQVGDRVNWSNVQAIRFWSQYYRGSLDVAKALAERLRRYADEGGNNQHKAWGHRFCAACDLRRGQPSSAVHHLEQALDALGNARAINETLPVLGLLALARFRSGDRGRAFEDALEGFEQMESVSRPTGHATLEGYAALTEVAFHALLEDRQSPTWQSAFRTCLQSLQRYQRVFRIGKPRYYIWLGLWRALEDRPQASRRKLEKAYMIAGRLAMPWERDLAAMALRIGPTQFLDDLRHQAAETASPAATVR